jgi:hypothetical protein
MTPRSLSEFIRTTADLLDRLRKTGHLLVLTINGKAELVVQDAALRSGAAPDTTCDSTMYSAWYLPSPSSRNVTTGNEPGAFWIWITLAAEGLPRFITSSFAPLGLARTSARPHRR